MIVKRSILRGILALLGLLAIGAARANTLDDFAQGEGLTHILAFDRTVISLRTNDQLPADLYVTKGVARRLGWHPGANLCPTLGGHMIGGDRFDNREGALPAGTVYREADLDEEDCGRRGPKRLIFDDHGDLWVTLDHYQSFQKVP